MFWVRLITVLLTAFPAFAQSTEEVKQRANYSQAELDQMLAPIALYPDSLLSQVLMAATYPLEIVQAARWARANPQLQGEEAVHAVAQFDWDPSVKSLVAFARLLQQLDEKLEWTERLGNAFLGQEYDLMRVVQQLRWRAYAAGNLRSGNEVAVRLEGTDISLDTASAETVYVPNYDARAVYGEWDWPQYQPVYWAPWAGPAYAVAVSPAFFFATCDWAAGHVRYGLHRPFYYRNLQRWQRGALWRHDFDHRRGVTYRNVDARHRAPATLDRPVHRVSQPGAGVPRAEVRTAGSLSRPLSAMPATIAQEPRPHALDRPVAPAPAPAPAPVPAPPALAPPVQLVPRALEPSPLARPETPIPPPQVQAPGNGDPNALRRRER